MGEEVLKGFVRCVEIENLCLFNNLLVFQYLLASYCSTMLNGQLEYIMEYLTWKISAKLCYLHQNYIIVIIDHMVTRD